MINLFQFALLSKQEFIDLAVKAVKYDEYLNKAKLEQDVKLQLEETKKKYPSTLIKYAGTPKKGNAAFPIDVRNYALCGQNDEDLKQFLGSLSVQNVMNSKGITYHEACDEVVVKINQITKVNYALDTNNYGFSEYWQFAPLTFKISQGDCDDYAVLRYVLCRIAGVDADLLRIGIGLTYSGEGHATNYYLCSDGIWLHLNSTSNFTEEENTLALQTIKDNTLAIKDFWFSFNELNAWSKLESKQAIDSFKEQKLFKQV